MKRLIDILMLVDFLILTLPHIFGDIVHECLGVVFILLVAIHLYLNRSWFKTIFRSPKDPVSIALIIVNCLLLLDIIFIALSGISMSITLFGFIRFMSLDLARKIHLACVYWAYPLIGIHLGMNFTSLIGAKRLKKIGENKLYPFIMTAVFMIALYGGWTFNTEGIARYMFFMNSFVDPSYGLHPILTLLSNFSMLVLWTFLSYQVTKSVRLMIEQNKRAQK